jgi:uncharacterized protein YdhG (YjbR/CyaY superfamily)
MNTGNKNKPGGVSDFEKEAMRNRAKELAAEARMNKNKAEGEKSVISAIAKMPEPDRSMAKRIHEIVKATAPDLFPKTWYGMPAYANKDGKVVCFFQAASKFKYRYATLGFQEDANLDEDNMWPTAFALKKLSSADETKIISILKKAVR